MSKATSKATSTTTSTTTTVCKDSSMASESTSTSSSTSTSTSSHSITPTNLMSSTTYNPRLDIWGNQVGDPVFLTPSMTRMTSTSPHSSHNNECTRVPSVSPSLSSQSHSYNGWTTSSSIRCSNCQRKIGGQRFVSHMEKCLGLGGMGGRRTGTPSKFIESRVPSR
mmetsp:Transcript_13426/g.27394  ORF Transcript_13426/g.27394 Transcript_13426/m.27394 type:complete len:166 (-) Transcript_13426:24-521(-)